MTTKTYDKRCWELAFLFLSDEPEEIKPTPDDIEELAIAIQQAIEDWLDSYHEGREAERESKD